MSGRSALMGAAHWIASSNIFVSTSASTTSPIEGSTNSATLPSLNLLKACKILYIVHKKAEYFIVDGKFELDWKG